MGEASQIEGEYVAAISKVLQYVQDHLDEPLTPHKLADVACFSQHHFHRIFRAVVGESVMDHVRRLRLERAAYRLKTSQQSVAYIALDAGYGAQEAFTRIFQAYFGLAPRNYRHAHAGHLIPAACGVHFAPNGFTPLRRATEPGLLDPDRLCAAHRIWSAEFEKQWELMLDVIIGFSALISSTSCRGNYPKELPRTMTETMTEIDKEIDALQNEVEAVKQKLIEARKRRPKELVQDYVFQDANGAEVKLSELFGDKSDLILVHNMGTGCVYCTMWADGFTGLVPHLSDRSAFVVSSPDKPEVQKRFAEKRNWNFKMVSAHEGTFVRDMGFWSDEPPHPGPWPGVSTFHKEADGKIYRVAKSHFGPGDDFCAAWPFFDLLQDGANGWEAQYFYGEKRA